ncbi:DNA-binding response regulator [Gemmatimonadetes bacterium T265]|nr:DNA-binding response regulator [Gemmatimonadetes bacterium T265]
MSRAIRVAIVDDEALARERAADVLRGRGDVEIVAECGDGLAAAAYLRRALAGGAGGAPPDVPDVILLDIQMPGLTGFEVLAAVREPSPSEGSPGDALGGARDPRRTPAPLPPVVFLTAYDRHALDAFEAGAVDYVLKPYADARLLAAVDRALRFGTPARDVDAVLAAAGPALPPRLVARRYGELSVIPFAEIRWVAAQGNYLEVHDARGAVHLVAGTVDDLARRLPPAFARVHRSAIVRLDCVRRVASEGHGDATLTLDRGERVRASRRFRAALERLLG